MDDIKNPSAKMRPAPFWSWNDKLDEEELRRQIREMADKGWGGYFMHSRVGLVTRYLSDEWMQMIRACADEAEKTGTLAWLYDEDKWPSGFAGGEVPRKDKAFRSRALVLLKKENKTTSDTELAEYEYNSISYSICCRVSELDSTYFNGASYVDLMNPEAVKEFISCTHDKYKESCGEYFGKSIPGIFTDEPCFLMYGHYNVPAVPWSDYLPDFFRSMKGYDINDHLPKLFFDIDDYRKIRFDFYDAASELFKQSFTKQYYDWCDENNMIMTGHFMAEDSLSYQTQWSGDVMTHYEFMHWPGIDKLARSIDQVVTVKQVTSAVDQLGKERSFCEVYGCMGGQASFFHRKWIGDWQAALGISFVNHHLSLYSMRGERKRDYPANLFYQQPWWDDEREFADYQGRLCALVSEGERKTDILMLQPLASVWSEYSPLHAETGFLQEGMYDNPFTYLSKRLMQEKLDYHYGNENLLAKFGSVEKNKFKVGRHVYDCVLIPPCCNIKSSTLKLLMEYAANGGKVIATGSAPYLIDGEPRIVNIPGIQIAASMHEAVNMVSALYPQRIKIIDTLTGMNATSVLVHERKSGSQTRYFITNTRIDREISIKITIPECDELPKSVLDLYTGSMYKIKNNDDLKAILYPAGSIVIICGDEILDISDDLPDFVNTGCVFKDIAGLSPSLVLDDLKCTIFDDNTHLLNDFILEMNGKKIYEGPVCGSWHGFFYAAEDGTPFRAIYSFDSEESLLDCYAAIETAENLDKICFNGSEVKPLKSKGELGIFDPNKSWLDINFTKVPLPEIKRGINTLIIEGKKYNNITGPGSHMPIIDWQSHFPTEAEEIYICGKFNVRSLSERQFILTGFNNPAGYNITREGFPFYSGKIGFKSSFRIAGKPSGKVYIKLNGSATASSRVLVNGQYCGTLYWEPMIADITDAIKSGENKLEIVSATTLVNAFGPNRMAGIKDHTGIGPDSFINMNNFKQGYELFDFGLDSIGIYIE